MFYSFSLTPFIFFIVFHHFLIPFSNANPSIDDKMLIAFMKGHQETKLSEFSMQKYEAHLGFMYYMRKNWHCDQIGKEFEEFERTECQKYGKYLDILHEYLYREYAGIPTVKPKFVYKRQIEIEGPIIYAVNCLCGISEFYFDSYWSQYHEYELNELFDFYFEPKLLNEDLLNYEVKLKNEPQLSINEIILQLAIDTANEWQTKESLYGIIRQNFEKNLEEVFKKAEERAKEDNPNIAYNDMDSKFDDRWTWNEDALFSEFVKGLATNFDKFFKMAKEFSNYLSRKKKYGIIFGCDDDNLLTNFGLYEIEKMKEHLTQKYEARLGLLYLLRETWQCDEIADQLTKYKRKEYLDILYEYFFRLYAEAKNPKVSKHLPPLVKPIFIERDYSFYQLIKIVETLNTNSNLFWQKDEYSLEYEIKLVNEEELNFENKVEKNWYHKKIKKQKQILNGQTEIERIREEFVQKMEEMYKNANENAKEENEKLEKAIENAANYKEIKGLRKAYKDKFGKKSLFPK